MENKDFYKTLEKANEKLRENVRKANEQVKEQEGLHEDIKRAAFTGRWIVSGILPVFASVVLAVSTWMYNHNANKEYNDAKEDVKNKQEQVNLVRDAGVMGDRYMEEHPNEAFLTKNYRKSFKSASEYHAADRELKEAQKKESELKGDVESSEPWPIIFTFMVAFALFVAVDMAKEDGVKRRPFKKFDPNRIHKMFANFEYGVIDPKEEEYFGTEEYVSFAEKVEDLGKAGTKILKEFAKRSGGSKAYINDIEHFNWEQQVAILQGYLERHPQEAEEIFKKVKALNFPRDIFENVDVDYVDKLALASAFRAKRKQELENSIKK